MSSENAVAGGMTKISGGNVDFLAPSTSIQPYGNGDQGLDL